MIHLDNLVIEITRRCQLQCGHCLRGDRQNLDIDEKYIDALFKQIDCVSMLTITGGEPALAIDKIKSILTLAKENNVEIDSFYLATNGLIQSPEFIMALIELYFYSASPEYTRVDISNDEFHDNDQGNNNKLSALSFVGKKFNKDFYDYGGYTYLINDGFCNFGSRHLDLKGELQELEVCDDQIMVRDMIYLNCNGDIVLDCDMSYETQDYNIVCDVYDLSKIINEAAENLEE